MRDYTKIEAWPPARLPARREGNTAKGKTLQLGETLEDLTVAVYERTRSFPKEEIYGLTSQLRRVSGLCLTGREGFWALPFLHPAFRIGLR